MDPIHVDSCSTHLDLSKTGNFITPLITQMQHFVIQTRYKCIPQYFLEKTHPYTYISGSSHSYTHTHTHTRTLTDTHALADVHTRTRGHTHTELMVCVDVLQCGSHCQGIFKTKSLYTETTEREAV